MRSLGAALAWVLTTVLLAVAVPAVWVQQHLIDRGGYAALSRSAATDPELQAAAAGELAVQAGRLGYTADPALVAGVATAYTASPSFPGQFAAANALAHRWLFDGVPATESAGGPAIDFAPLMSDPAFAQTLRGLGGAEVSLPETLPVPIAPDTWVRPGALRQFAVWSPISVALVALTAASALLTLRLASSRGKAIAALGVSALLVGATGLLTLAWAADRLVGVLGSPPGDMGRIVDVMAATATDSAHRWLIVTVIAGGGLVLVGVVVALLTSLASAGVKASGAGTSSSARL